MAFETLENLGNFERLVVLFDEHDVEVGKVQKPVSLTLYHTLLFDRYQIKYYKLQQFL